MSFGFDLLSQIAYDPLQKDDSDTELTSMLMNQLLDVVLQHLVLLVLEVVPSGYLQLLFVTLDLFHVLTQLPRLVSPCFVLSVLDEPPRSLRTSDSGR